jgi:hypothetical protein
MKALLTLTLFIVSTFSFAATDALVCTNGQEITNAEIFEISQAKYELNYQFNEGATQQELLQQTTDRIEATSPVLAQMFANVYLTINNEDNINLGRFAFETPAQTQIYRICDNATNLPNLTTIAKQEKTLKIDETVYNKLNDLNKSALILEQVLNKLNMKTATERDYFFGVNRKSKKPILNAANLDKLVADLLSSKESESLKRLLSILEKELIKNKIANNYKTRVENYTKAGSFEQAKKILANSRLELDHGVSVEVKIEQRELEPYELAKLKRQGLPADPAASFWGLPGGFIGASAIGGISNAVSVVVTGANLAVAAGTGILIVGVTVGATISAYSIIVNTMHRRRVKLLQQSYDLVNGVKNKKRLLDRFYRQFKRKISGVTKLEYAQRVIDLSYENAFGKKPGKFVGALKMKKIIIESFK